MSIPLKETEIYSNKVLSDVLKELAASDFEEVFYNTGDQIIKPEDTDNDFYIIDQGRVKREGYDAFGGPVVMRVLRSGYFGHFSLVHQVPNMLSIVALSPLYLFKLKKDKFEEFLKVPKFAAVFEDKAVRHTDFVDRLKNLSLFSLLTESELANIVGQIEVVKVATDTDLLKLQHDNIELAVISSGKVMVSRPNGEPLKEISMSRGNFIGPLSELPNINDIKIKTVDQVTLFTLSKEGVADLLKQVPRLQPVLARQDVTDQLGAVKLFSKFSPDDRQFLAWMVGHARFGKNKYIYRQGDPGTRYGIIYQGEFELRVLDSDGKKPIAGSTWLNIEPGSSNVVVTAPPLPPKFEKFNIINRLTIFLRSVIQKIQAFADDVKANGLKKVLRPWLKSGMNKLVQWFSSEMNKLVQWLNSMKDRLFKKKEVKQTVKQEPPKVPKKVERYIFGEKSVFLKQAYPEGLWTSEPTELFFIDQSDFSYIRAKNEHIDQCFDPEPLVKQSFQYASFDDLKKLKLKDEDIIYYCRRHWIAFVTGLFTPPTEILDRLQVKPKYWPSADVFILMAIILATILWIYSDFLVSYTHSFYNMSITGLVSFIVVGLILLSLWVWWTWVDWHNDYLVITNKRVIQRESVVMFHEYQTEAELGKIQSVNLSSTFLGRMFGYGDLTITTAGTIKTIFFDKLPQPSVLYNSISTWPLFRLILPSQKDALYANKILDTMSKERKEQGQFMSRQSTLAKLKKSLQAEIGSAGVDPWQKAEVAKPLPPKLTDWQKRRQGWSKSWATFWDTILPWRFGAIKPDPTKNIHVWRKHWTNLVWRIMDSVTAFIVFTVIVGLYMTGRYLYVSSTSIYLDGLIGLIYIAILARLWWEIADWGNDLYILTDKHVIDIEKNPMFFKENRNQAELERIENVRFEQKGWIANAFNYGDVVIETAGKEPLTFTSVHKPRDVQALIFIQKELSKFNLKTKETTDKDREITKWFDAYHNTYVNLGN